MPIYIARGRFTMLMGSAIQMMTNAELKFTERNGNGQ